MHTRRKAYQVWSEQLSGFERRIDKCETRLLQAWEVGDSQTANHFETKLKSLHAGREAVYFSMENATNSN